MSQTSLSVWFVCRLCRGSFGQVDAFIEHKKQKHFTQFQNITSIIFKERELGHLYPIITSDSNANHQIVDESIERQIKIEVSDDDPIIPFSSEINEEPNLSLVEPKSELITYESEINPDNKNTFFGLKQPKPNPYVLLKRLTFEEIQSVCVPQSHSSLLKCEQKIVTNSVEPPNSSDFGSNSYDHNEVEKLTEIQPTPTVELYLQFECKLCSKQLQSNGQLKIHVGICALYNEDRNRFCVSCNRKFYATVKLKDHRLRFHGTEEEKLSLFKFKCHLCPKKYQRAIDLRYHLESHKKKKQQKTPNSTPFMCSHPNCGKEFQCNSKLQSHIAAVHLGVKPFSCSFPNCYKSFSRTGNLNAHLLIHTGERPFKCTVDNCGKAFRTSTNRSVHHRRVHCNL